MFSKFVALLFVITVSVMCGILVMIYGWGLSPRSWWWIIGVGFFMQLFLQVIVDLLKKEGEK